MVNCQHEGCIGELIYQTDMEEKGRFGVFRCNKCKCRFSIVNVYKEVGCPSLKGEKSLNTSKLKSKGKRGRPKKAMKE